MTTHVERSIEVAGAGADGLRPVDAVRGVPALHVRACEEVRQVGDALTHWVAQIAGVRREWDAEIIEQVPDQKVAWAATTGATNAGAVFFDDVGADRTRVRLTLEFEPEGIVERIGGRAGHRRPAGGRGSRPVQGVHREAGARRRVAGEARSRTVTWCRMSTGSRGTPERGLRRRRTADDVPGDVVAVGPTGEHREHPDDRAGRRAVGPAGGRRDGARAQRRPDRRRSRCDAATGPPTDRGDGAHRRRCVVVRRGRRRLRHEHRPEQRRSELGRVTGDPGARATASHAGGTGTRRRGRHRRPPRGVDRRAGGAQRRDRGVHRSRRRRLGQCRGRHQGTTSRSATTGTDEPWASGGSGPGEDRGVRATGEDGVVQRDFADEDISTDDVVARDFANRDISGEGVVERDFANRDITERDIAEPGCDGRGGAGRAADVARRRRRTGPRRRRGRRTRPARPPRGDGGRSGQPDPAERLTVRADSESGGADW